MNIDILKEHLSEELFNTLNEQLKDKDGKLANLASGDYVELKNKIIELELSNKKQQEEYEQKIKQTEFDYTLHNALKESKVRDVKSVLAHLDTSKISIEDGKLLGLDEQIKGLKENNLGFLFEEEKSTNPPQSGNKFNFGDKDPFVAGFDL